MFNPNLLQKVRIFKRSRSAAVLAEQWPLTFEACVRTYFDEVTFSRIDEASHCPAGYMLQAVVCMQEDYERLHEHRPVAREILDRAAAHEIWYHYRRGRVFRNPPAALFASLRNLVRERPERVWTIRA